MNELCYTNNPKSLFRKYALLITSLTKHQAFRDYVMDRTMPLPQEELGLLLPNGYHEHLGGNHYRMTVTTRAVYSPKLYFSLLKLDLMLERWSLSFEDQQTILLMDLGLKRYSFEYPQVFLAQETFNPDANPETTSVDGRVGRIGAADPWATKHDGAGDAVNDSSASQEAPQIHMATTEDSYSEIYRFIELYDTSSLGGGAIIEDTSKNRYFISAKRDQFLPAQSLTLVTCTPNSNTALASSDYNIANWSATRQAADVTIASITTSAYLDMILNATGRSNVSKTGITKFGKRLIADADNVEPTWSNAAFADVTGNNADNASNKPQLVLDYTIPGAAYFM